jgi:CTP-dependent riboflavin kinase
MTFEEFIGKKYEWEKKRYNLTIFILDYLKDHSEVRCKDIAKIFHCSAQLVAKQMKFLIKRKLVKREEIYTGNTIKVADDGYWGYKSVIVDGETYYSKNYGWIEEPKMVPEKFVYFSLVA